MEKIEEKIVHYEEELRKNEKALIDIEEKRNILKDNYLRLQGSLIALKELQNGK
jgi:hypothetical protein